METTESKSKKVRAPVVAEALNCALSTVYAMAAKGQIPSITIGSRGRRFDLEEVLKARQTNMVQTEEKQP